MRQSLTKRSIILNTAFIIILVFCTWLATSYAFKHIAKRSLSKHIGAYIDLLITSTDIDDNGNIIIDDMDDTLASIPRYWQITSNGKPIKKSHLLDNWLKVNQSNNKKLSNIKLNDSDNTNIIIYQEEVKFPDNNTVTYLFGMQAEIADELLKEYNQDFSKILTLILSALVVLLIILSLIQLRFYLSPFTRIKNSLKQYSHSKQEFDYKNYPREILPLTREIDNLIKANNRLVTKYRGFASDLSHSLKTPLTILINDAKSKDKNLRDTVLEKSDLMHSIIERNLARVNIMGKATNIGSKLSLHSITNKIASNFARIYNKKYTVNCPSNINYPIDENDYYEMLGNLIENACKYGKSKFDINIVENTDNITITVDDDGSGVPKTKHKDILERGIRLDETTKGTGIGLAITKDISSIYGGNLTLDKSGIGGLKVVISLPKKY